MHNMTIFMVNPFKNSILNMKDIDSNGYYDVNDFLNMKNEEIIKINKGKKFNIILMNPPYGNRKYGDEFLHHKMTEKCLELSDNVICIMPAKLCTYDTSKDKNRKHFKEVYDNRLVEVEIINSSVFQDTAMMNVGIHVFNKDNHNNIKIIDIDKNEKSIKSLLDISQFNDYEKEIAKYLEIDIKKANCWLCQVAKNKKILDKWCKNIQKHNKHVYLTSNSANGGMNGTWFSKTVGKVFDNIDDLKQNFAERRGAVCVVMLFDSIKAAKNCRDAMKRPLLRWGLYRTQDDQSLRRKVYKYIPDIDWEDDRVKTDEGLLEVCGCPKDKAKEYAEYCKNTIDKVDKK